MRVVQVSSEGVPIPADLRLTGVLRKGVTPCRVVLNDDRRALKVAVAGNEFQASLVQLFRATAIEAADKAWPKCVHAHGTSFNALSSPESDVEQEVRSKFPHVNVHQSAR